MATARGLKAEKVAALLETTEGGGRAGRPAPGAGVECPELDWLVEPGCDMMFFFCVEIWRGMQDDASIGEDTRGESATRWWLIVFFKGEQFLPLGGSYRHVMPCTVARSATSCAIPASDALLFVKNVVYY